MGAVNVIEVQPDGSLVGHNTDYVGFRESLRHFYPSRGAAARALVLGTGGAAKAVSVALRELDIPHWLVSRDPLSAHLTYAELTPALVAGYPLIINTTPPGHLPPTWPTAPPCLTPPSHPRTTSSTSSTTPAKPAS